MTIDENERESNSNRDGNYRLAALLNTFSSIDRSFFFVSLWRNIFATLKINFNKSFHLSIFAGSNYA